MNEIFININSPESKNKSEQWLSFLKANNFDFLKIKEINMGTEIPVVKDLNGNKFSIDFLNDRANYHKTKKGIKTEILSKAMGAGRYGLNILDLTAGLAVDSIFLAQLGYQMTAIERNPLIYLCLKNAADLVAHQSEQFKNLNVEFYHSEALDFLKNTKNSYDVIYFDPMFPEKAKSALPKQEMVAFKNLVGQDEDSLQVLQQALKLDGIKRVVVKRPIKAEPILAKPNSQVEGKLVRFDIYGVKNVKSDN